MIYPNDHLPPHVHAIHAQGAARISIEGKPRLLTVEGLSPMLARRARSLVIRHQAAVVKVWRTVHG